MPQLFEVNMYDLRPIRDRETHQATLTEIEQLGIPAQTLIQPYLLASG